MRVPVQPLLLAGLLAALSPSALADLLVGQVVDANGVPVAFVDIDVDNKGSGGDPNIANDGTDANGNFAVTVPAGTFDIIFNPPKPPAAVAGILTLPDVVISGTTDLGVVALPPAVALTGRVVTQGGAPVAGVNLDVIELASGDNIDLVGDTTDALGKFSMAVPAGAIELRLDPPATQPGLAPVAYDHTLAAGADLGDILMPDGWQITGILLGSGGQPLGGVDLDVFEVATGKEIYTPKDNTQSTGFFSMTVPAGSYEVQSCPPKNLHQVSSLSPANVAGAPVSLGVIQLQAGFLLSGKVSSSLAAGQAGVDVDAYDAGTGAKIPLCGDDTTATGTYSVVLPPGQLDLQFSPKGYDQPIGALQLAGYSLSGNQTLNPFLPDCPFHTAYGVGSAGSGGFVPALGSSGGTPRAGNFDYRLEVSGALGGSVAVVALGFGQTALPLYGGTLLVDPLAPGGLLFLVKGTGPAGLGTGSASLPLPAPIQGDWSGLSIYLQAGVYDPGAAGEVALSNAILVTFCD